MRYSGSLGSTYIPLDSWMYPEIMRLYSLGFIDTVFLGMRPYTRTSVAHMLDASAGRIYNSDSDEAKEIYSALSRELAPDLEIPVDPHRTLDLAGESRHRKLREGEAEGGIPDAVPMGVG